MLWLISILLCKVSDRFLSFCSCFWVSARFLILALAFSFYTWILCSSSFMFSFTWPWVSLSWSLISLKVCSSFWTCVPIYLLLCLNERYSLSTSLIWTLSSPIWFWFTCKSFSISLISYYTLTFYLCDIFALRSWFSCLMRSSCLRTSVRLSCVHFIELF